MLYVDLLFKAGFGLALLLFPLLFCKVFGLPRPNTGFWPRILGASFLGQAGALFLEGAVPNTHGLGLGGALTINLSIAAILASMIILGAVGEKRRAQALLWLLVVVLVTLSLFELAYVTG